MACLSCQASALLFLVLTCCTYFASAGHRHRHVRHKHVHRETLSAFISTSQPVISATAAADDLAADIQTLRNHLAQFPGDLLNVVGDVAARIDELEDLLNGLLDPTSNVQTDIPQGLFTSTSVSAQPSAISISQQAAQATSVLSSVVQRTSHTSILFTTIVTAAQGLPFGTLVRLPEVNASQPPELLNLLVTTPTGAVRTSTSTVTPSISTQPVPTTTASALPSNPATNNSTINSVTTPSTEERKFSSQNSTNLAVYHGITPATTATSLLTLCANPSITIINLAFLTTFFGPNGYPTVTFGPGCTGPNPIRSAAAPGLSSCSVLAAQILACQKTYKTKILISLGGWNAASSFNSSRQAVQFAHTLWNLFGSGKPSPQDMLLRPFGPVKIDGFDIDNESHNPAYYTEFVVALRKLYAQDRSKRYYISAAPQCPRPEESIPLAAMRMVDLVHVQFYNNPGCNLGSEGFLASVKAWSEDLSVAGNSRWKGGSEGTGLETRGPLMFIGAPAWPAGAGSGYVGPSVFEGLMGRVKMLKLANLGGVMLWDGSEGVGNVGADGRSFVDVAGKALA